MSLSPVDHIALLTRLDAEAPAPAVPPAPPPGVAHAGNGRATGGHASNDSRTRRAAAYLVSKPPAVAGQHGHDDTFDAACVLVKGFGLSIDDARPILEGWSARCVPPWSDRELTHKLEDADTKPDRRPRGYLFDAPLANGRRDARLPGAAGDPAQAVSIVNEAPDDPHGLARVVLKPFVDARGRRTLVHYKGNFYAWNGAAYRPDPIFATTTVVNAVKAEIDRLNVEAVTRYNMASGMRKNGRPTAGAETCVGGDEASDEGGRERGRPAGMPVAKRVTTGLIRDVTQALAAMSSIDREGDAPFWIAREEGDPDPHQIIPARNGLVDISGDVPMLRPHSPRLFSTNVLSYDYAPNAPKPKKWLQFLRDQWPDDDESINALHEVLGDMLAPDARIHALHLWIGPPRSGRGTIRDVAYDLIGRWNVTATSPESLSGPFGLESLLDKKLAVMGDARTGDAHDSAVLMDRLLRITGGDPVEVNRKGRPILPDVRMNLRILLMSNDMPNFRDASGAIVTRYVVLNTKKTIPKEARNPRLGEALKDELPSILNYAIRGLKRMRKRGRFLQPKSAAHLIDDAEDIASPVRVFVAERKCPLGEKENVGTSLLFDEWKRWAMTNGYPIGNTGTFGKNLKSAYPHIRKTRPRGDDGVQIPIYEGIGGPIPF